MNDIITINGIECYEKDGTAYLNLEAVARGLGFTTVATSGNEVVRWNTVYRYLCDLSVATSCNGSDYRSMCPDFIPENIFYRLAMKAKNEAAEQFQAKIADEVIPSIRKHGAYMTHEVIERTLTDPDFIIRLATQLKNEQISRKLAEEKARLLDEKIKNDAPKVEFAEHLEKSPDSIDMKTMAKIASKKGIKIGRNKLYDLLRLRDVLDRNNEPYQTYMEREWFEVIESTYRAYGEIKICRTTYVLPKGQDGIIRLLKKYY